MARRALPSRLVLLGHPVTQSLSPRFQNAALAAAGLAIPYTALDVLPADLARVLAGLREEDAAGNVTIPHKQAVAVACTHVMPLAARTRAVNTFWFEQGELHGDNTDVGGFIASVDALLGLGPAARWPGRIAVLGAGGAARAVLAAVELRGGAGVDLHVRDAQRGEALAAEFPFARVRAGAPAADVGLVVNATPVGMRDDSMPLPVDDLPPAAAVQDLVYRPGETAWVRASRAAGHRAADGTEMLLAQGALAFERFTGLQPDRQVMRDSLTRG